MRISDWSSDVCSSDLHRRASRYFAETGDLLEAIEHAHLSRDQAFLAGQLESLSEDIIYSGFLYRLDELGSALPWKLLSRHPMLLLALAWRRTRRLAFASIGIASCRERVCPYVEISVVAVSLKKKTKDKPVKK